MPAALLASWRWDGGISVPARSAPRRRSAAREDLSCAEIELLFLGNDVEQVTDFEVRNGTPALLTVPNLDHTRWRYQASGCGKSARYHVTCSRTMLGHECEPKLLYFQSPSATTSRNSP